MRSSFEPRPLPGASPDAFVPEEERQRAAAAGASAQTPDAEPEVPHDTGAEDRAALRTALAALEAALESSQRAHVEERRRWLRGALEIGLALARRVLQRELILDPLALRPLVERALRLLEHSTRIEVAFSPETLEVFEAEGGGALREREDVVLSADPSLGTGEARVCADASRVDVRLETLLSGLREELVPGWEETL